MRTLLRTQPQERTAMHSTPVVLSALLVAFCTGSVISKAQTPAASGTAAADTTVNPDVVVGTIAWSANDTLTFANFTAEFVGHSAAPAESKSALLARAAMLAHHASKQSQRIEAFGAKGSSAEPSDLKDLQARDEGLRNERRELASELSVWQVQHGLIRAEDTDLVYVPVEPGC